MVESQAPVRLFGHVMMAPSGRSPATASLGLRGAPHRALLRPKGQRSLGTSPRGESQLTSLLGVAVDLRKPYYGPLNDQAHQPPEPIPCLMGCVQADPITPHTQQVLNQYRTDFELLKHLVANPGDELSLSKSRQELQAAFEALDASQAKELTELVRTLKGQPLPPQVCMSQGMHEGASSSILM